MWWKNSEIGSKLEITKKSNLELNNLIIINTISSFILFLNSILSFNKFIIFSSIAI
jgi:hypothetical protein